MTTYSSYLDVFNKQTFTFLLIHFAYSFLISMQDLTRRTLKYSNIFTISLPVHNVPGREISSLTMMLLTVNRNVISIMLRCWLEQVIGRVAERLIRILWIKNPIN